MLVQVNFCTGVRVRTCVRLYSTCVCVFVRVQCVCAMLIMIYVGLRPCTALVSFTLIRKCFQGHIYSCVHHTRFYSTFPVDARLKSLAQLPALT